jgi:hypothetical protein
MSVEIGNEVTQVNFWENINRIFFVVYEHLRRVAALPNILIRIHSSIIKHGKPISSRHDSPGLHTVPVFSPGVGGGGVGGKGDTLFCNFFLQR